MAQALPFREWKRQVERVAAKAPMERVTQLQRQLVFLALGAAIVMPNGGLARVTGVIARTPVDTGRARASWIVTVGGGTPANRSVPAEGSYAELKSHNGAVAHGTAAAGQALAGLQPGQTVWISSALPYILVLEFGGYPNPPKRGSYDKKTKSWVVKSAGGFSRQAPQGMVRVTFEELTRILQEALP